MSTLRRHLQFLSWNTSRRLQLFLFVEYIAPAPAVPVVEYIAPAPAVPVVEYLAPASSCSCHGAHRTGLQLFLSWKTLRQHLSLLQLQSWSTSRQFRLQRQLCQVFNLVKVRIEFSTEVPTVSSRHHHDEWLRAECVLRACAARQGYLFRQMKRRGPRQLAAQLTSLGKACEVARGSSCCVVAGSCDDA